jgi:hypothetical protein
MLCKPGRSSKKDLTFKKFFDIIYIESEREKKNKKISHEYIKIVNTPTIHFSGLYPPPLKLSVRFKGLFVPFCKR